MVNLKKRFITLTASMAVVSSLVPGIVLANTTNSSSINTNNTQNISVAPSPDPESSIGTAPLIFKSNNKTVSPRSTISGNAGSATIYYTGKGPNTLYWSLNPSFIGPYYVSAEITITNISTKKVVKTIPVSTGKLLGGSTSAQVDVGYLPKGNYDAVLTGTASFDFGEATILSPNTAFRI
ncbi:hypothetical protein [Aneurinibacillus terranovensis]|uniref:hypothetical protein n=1 Tax=Aneurinibacillus terranovensis TaxID=278991 RepID=UPI0004844464|nr:hypothetical protein [Aneurinibacillus terranovensis]